MFQLLLFSLVFSVFGAPSKYENKIVGGKSATIEEYPYQVSLHYFGSFTCGGSIIAPRFVVTAAHCTFGESESAFTVRVGSNETSSNGQEIAVEKIYQNPSYSTSTMDYDITILYLFTSIQFGPAALPIALAPKDFKLDTGSNIVVTGWGTLSEGGVVPDELQVVQVPYISNEQCQEKYKDSVVISQRMLCAQAETGGKDACQGDSGGPLVFKGLLVGVVSWGFGCARVEFPGVYSRISEFRDFIQNVTQI